MGRGRTRRFNFLKLLILNDKNMKKEYVTPSLKVLKLNVELSILAGSDINNNVAPNEILFNDWENSEVDYNFDI
jgi:hypothetical protein